MLNSPGVSLSFSLPDIEQEGIVILRDCNSLPHTKQEFTSPSVVISMVTQGESKGFYEHQPVVVKAGDVSVIMPFHSCMDTETSEDYRVSLIILSPSFVEDMESLLNYRTRARFHYQPTVHLSPDQFSIILHALDTLQDICNMKQMKKRKELMISMLSVLGETIDFFRGEQDQPTQGRSRKEELFNRFYALLTTQYQDQHTVLYYADQLHVNAKYLSRCIFELTGYTANYWIDSVLTLQSKQLLINYPTLSVKSICYKLGFGEMSNFTRFFRRNTGYSPIEYRKKMITPEN